MYKLFALAAFLAATPVFAADNPDCVKFSNAAFAGEPDAVRIRLSLNAIRSSYKLDYKEADLAKLSGKIEAKIGAKQMTLDGLERIALFGCTLEMGDEDGSAVKQQLDSILNEK